jgi:hypothetical protein
MADAPEVEPAKVEEAKEDEPTVDEPMADAPAVEEPEAEKPKEAESKPTKVVKGGPRKPAGAKKAKKWTIRSRDFTRNWDRIKCNQGASEIVWRME